MNSKFNILLTAIGLCISTPLSAQTEIKAAGTADNLVDNGGCSEYYYDPGPSPTPWIKKQYPIAASAIAIQDKGTGHMTINAYEKREIDPIYANPNIISPAQWSIDNNIIHYTRTSSMIKWEDSSTGGSSGFIPITHSWPTFTSCSDPDIEFSPDYTAFFVSFKNSAGTNLYLQKFTWNTGTTSYVYAGQATIPTIGNIEVSNIDIAMYNGEPQGVITWYDTGVSSKIYACAFDQGLSISPRVEIADDGRGPDVAVCSNSELYHISYMDYNTKIKVKTGAWGDLLGVISPTLAYTSPLDGYNPGRIASPHNQTGSLNTEDFTVVASAGNNMIRGFSFNATSTTYQDYDISTNAGTSDNRGPVVCYNSDRIKCMWTSDYSSGSAYSPAPTSPPRDVLLVELDPFTYGNMYGVIWEVNKYDVTNPLNFWNSSISIAETRNEQAPTNSDYNAFLFCSADPNNDALPKHEIHNKKLFNFTTPKRLSISNLTNLTISKEQSSYILEGEELDKMQFELRNIKGQNIRLNQALEVSPESVIVSTSGLTKGLYFLNCKSKSENTTFKLIVK